MHAKQVKILKRLEHENGQKFSVLGKGFDFDDKFPYHLKQLIKNNLIYKEEGLYYITKEGLQSALYFDTGTLDPVQFKNVSISFVCRVGDSYVIHEKVNGDEKYYYFPRGKMLFGEHSQDACKRIFGKKTGVKEGVQFSYHSTHIKRQLTSSGELLFDSVSLFFFVNIPEKLHDKLQLTSHNKCINIEDIKQLPNRWPEIDIELFDFYPKIFYEYDFVCDQIL